MFKVKITDAVAYCDGKYGYESRTAMHRSPKVTWERIRTGRHCIHHADRDEGGTPVLQRTQVWRGSTLLHDDWD
jgi:hypothetical protein